MYLFYRAFAYIRKQKAKTILLLILFFVIGNIVLAGLSVQSATDTAKTLTREEIGSDITYSLNNQVYMNDVFSGVLDQNTDVSTLEGVPLYSNLLSIVDSDYVATYDAIYSFDVNSEELTPYTYVSTSTSTNTDTFQQPPGDRQGNFVSGTYTNAGDFSMQTFSTIEPSDFSSEDSTLIDGRYATQEEIDSGANVVLIETNLADANGLSVGDSITLTPVDSNIANATSYEIIGIYESTQVLDDRSAQMLSSSLLPQNTIYLPFNNLLTLGYSESDLNGLVLSSAIIALNDPADIDAFKAEAETKVSFTYGSLDANDAVYEQLAGPIESLGSTSSFMVIIVVIAGAAILSLITALTVNQRKNEIGILLSIGESKFNIVLQFITEVIAIATIAFTLSVFSGLQVGQQISSSILENYSTTETTNVQNFGPGQFTRPGEENAAQYEAVDVNVVLDLMIILEFFAAGLIISVVSVAIPALYVTRFNPKQILTNNG